MAHQSLYLAYRPQTFAEVAGQDHITGALQEAIASKKIGHAYLFAGSRGLGKTSIARIFARDIGCTEKDLYEIDAASNNSVDDIRALTEGVYTLPFESPYKVYILDEAHMLSKSAWNAFLKTLEEPPPHVVFILATTELDRVPETVASRCQVFEFKKPSRKALATHLMTVSKKEGYTLETDAADLIALLGDGSYRDALSVLQKVLTASSDKKLTRQEVEKCTGAPKRELVLELVTALAKGGRAAALAAIEKATQGSGDAHLFLSLTIEAIRNALLVRSAPDLREGIKTEIGEDEYASLLALQNEKGITHKTLLAFLEASDHMRYAPLPQIPLELAVFSLYPES